MAHWRQNEFCEEVRDTFPQYFRNKRVLDIGSLDINGSNKYLFEDCEYIGLDVGAGNNVDVVCIAHQYREPDASFDVIISTSCFEHDMFLAKTLQNAVRLLKPGGLFFFSCAMNWKEHGTATMNPEESPLTVAIPGWENYYHNVQWEDISGAINVEEIFEAYDWCTNKIDLEFWGIKKEK